MNSPKMSCQSRTATVCQYSAANIHQPFSFHKLTFILGIHAVGFCNAHSLECLHSKYLHNDEFAKSHAQLQKPAHLSKHTCDIKQNGTHAKPLFFAIVSCALKCCGLFCLECWVQKPASDWSNLFHQPLRSLYLAVLQHNQQRHKKRHKNWKWCLWCCIFRSTWAFWKMCQGISTFQHLAGDGNWHKIGKKDGLKRIAWSCAFWVPFYVVDLRGYNSKKISRHLKANLRAPKHQKLHQTETLCRETA